MKKLLKSATFTDIHFGRKNSSETHNQDCLNFITWIYESIKNDPTIDHIIFMGDFFESRNSINVATLNNAYSAVKLLDSLGLPIFFIIGNHDLYYRHNRSVYSTEVFGSLKNFILIDKPTFIDYVGNKGALFCPFLFPTEFVEYHDLINKSEIVFAHFELVGFIITGDTKIMDHGADPDDFKGPKRVFSGHYHKRQSRTNIIYTGSPFAMDYSDANDVERGYTVYNYKTDDVQFHNWKDGPSYVKTSLSELLDDSSMLKKDASVKCLADQDITLEEASKLKETFMKKYQLREFSFDEVATDDILEDTNMDLKGLEQESTDKIVTTLLGRIDNETRIKSEILIEIYEKL
ncbi:MAG: hypothetical protein JWP44_5052 [Mucilaginibacter sp.]|nr:hypothetical protein [Mucilaginibacter sp.]